MEQDRPGVGIESWEECGGGGEDGGGEEMGSDGGRGIEARSKAWVRGVELEGGGKTGEGV